jgi:hypothetical protein
MNVEIWAEAALFPEKEYISGIFVAVCMIWLLPPTPSPTLSSKISLSQSSCVSPVELTDGRVGRGWKRSQIIRGRESLVLYKSFNTLWKLLMGAGEDPLVSCNARATVGCWLLTTAHGKGNMLR